MQESWEDEEEEKKDEEKKELPAAPVKPKKKIADKIAEKEVSFVLAHLHFVSHRVKLDN